MLPLAETIRRRCIVDKVSKVREWIRELTKQRGELGGHSICPYAFSASVRIEETALSEVTLIEGADVTIFIVGDCSVAAMMATVDHLNMIHSDYMWLDDHKDEPTFIQGVQSNFGKDNLILCQKRDAHLRGA